MVVLLEGSPISTEELELCQSDHRVLGHLPDQGPSPTIAQFGWAASSRLVLVIPNFFHLRMMEATVFLGTLPQICASPLPRLGALPTIPLTACLGICSDMHCQLWDLLYRQLCSFPNHVQSIEFPTDGLQSRCRNISRKINGNRMYLSSIPRKKYLSHFRIRL